MKNEVGKLDIDKLASVPIHLSKLSEMIKNDVVKKDVDDARIKDVEDKTPRYY